MVICAQALLIRLRQSSSLPSAKESQFYGSMDGAMKFVKGDAIAGIIIVLVNLFGGVLIGMWQFDMPFSEALSLFSVLSVGDALVAQIPALIISVTAGLLLLVFPVKAKRRKPCR